MKIYILNVLDVDNTPLMLGVYSDRALAMRETEKACDEYESVELDEIPNTNGKFRAEDAKTIFTKCEW